MGARRSAHSTAIATLIHAALFLAIAKTAPAPPPSRAEVAPTAHEQEPLALIDVKELPSVARSRSAPEVGVRVRDERPSSNRKRSRDRAGRSPDAIEGAEPREIQPPGERPAEDASWSTDDEDWGALGAPALDGRPTALTAEIARDALDHPTSAPTRAPRRRRITARETNESVRSLVRMADRELGLGAPQETKISHAVQEAGRASGVPSGTAFAVTLSIDSSGAITSASIRGDEAGANAWPHVLAAIRGGLEGAPVPLGPDERATGATVRVEAKVLHVLPSGSEHAVTTGECPKMPLVGGETAPSFFNIGGTHYLEPPSGLCTLGDMADIPALRTIVVRTTTTTTRPGDAPKPLSAYPKPPKKKLLPTPMEFLTDLLNKASKPSK